MPTLSLCGRRDRPSRRPRTAHSGRRIASLSILPAVIIYAAAVSGCAAAQRDRSPAEFAEAAAARATAADLRGWHDLLASEPHPAGTPGDARTIERLRDLLESMGLEVHVHRFWPLLPRPVEASVTLLASDHTLELPVAEAVIEEDPDTAHPALDIGWNAWSGSGQVTAEVVYAHLGRAEDFAALEAEGIDVRGRIALIRYGGAFRGNKVSLAAEHGAVGVLLFIDPSSGGDAQGDVYPEGTWADDSFIQRGSIGTPSQTGDVLTPFIEATRDAPRLSLDEAALPTILVQPIGYGAARSIMAAMSGPAAPDAWHAGLGPTYRLGGTPLARVRLRVIQTREVLETANVIAVLPRHEAIDPSVPDRPVIIGGHHDAWTHGAADPLAGTIVTIETARVLSEMARDGWRPRRSIIFAMWGAEEYGIIGSTEWCEANRALLEHATAYVNLDMSAMGPNLGASGSPALTRIVLECAGRVPQAGDPSRTALQHWRARADGEPTLGTLGGGSDHVPFLLHLGIPSLSVGAGGAPGLSYHSTRDTLAWYRKTVGDDYESALMLTRFVTHLAVALADEPIVPFAPRDITPWLRSAMDGLELAAEGASVQLPESAEQLRHAIEAFGEVADGWDPQSLVPEEANRRLIAVERIALDADGIPGRPWYRNRLVATDPTTGYSAMRFPAAVAAVRAGDGEALDRALRGLTEVVAEMRAELAFE